VQLNQISVILGVRTALLFDISPNFRGSMLVSTSKLEKSNEDVFVGLSALGWWDQHAVWKCRGALTTSNKYGRGLQNPLPLNVNVTQLACCRLGGIAYTVPWNAAPVSNVASSRTGHAHLPCQQFCV